MTEEATLSPTCFPPLSTAFPWLPVAGTNSRVTTVQPWINSHFFMYTLLFMYILSFGHSATLGQWARQYCKFGNDLREFRMVLLGPIRELRQDPQSSLYDTTVP